MGSGVNNRTRVAGASLLLFSISLFLTAYSARNPALVSVGSGAVAELLSPVQRAWRWGFSGVAGVWNSYVAVWGARQESQQLKERLAALEQQNIKLQELQHENKQLSSLLQLKQESELSGIVARVIGYDASQWVQSLTIDRGTSDGVVIGAAVVEHNGLVGQVIAAAPNTAKILLITDPASGVDGIIQDTRARGIVEGAGPSQCRWRFVVREDEVRVGDRVLTSGMDGIYPRGVIVGTIDAADSKRSGLFQAIEIKPEVDFASLEQVFVVRRSDGVVGPVRPLNQNSAVSGADQPNTAPKKKRGA